MEFEDCVAITNAHSDAFKNASITKICPNSEAEAGNNWLSKQISSRMVELHCMKRNTVGCKLFVKI